MDDGSTDVDWQKMIQALRSPQDPSAPGPQGGQVQASGPAASGQQDDPLQKDMSGGVGIAGNAWQHGASGHETGLGAMLGGGGQMIGQANNDMADMIGGKGIKNMLGKMGGGNSGGGGGGGGDTPQGTDASNLGGLDAGAGDAAGAADAMPMMMAAHGANFTARGPTPLMVGEAGPEHVRVTPMNPTMRRPNPGIPPKLPFGYGGRHG